MTKFLKCLFIGTILLNFVGCAEVQENGPEIELESENKSENESEVKQEPKPIEDLTEDEIIIINAVKEIILEPTQYISSHTDENGEQIYTFMLTDRGLDFEIKKADKKYDELARTYDFSDYFVSIVNDENFIKEKEKIDKKSIASKENFVMTYNTIDEAVQYTVDIDNLCAFNTSMDQITYGRYMLYSNIYDYVTTCSHSIDTRVDYNKELKEQQHLYMVRNVVSDLGDKTIPNKLLKDYKEKMTDKNGDLNFAKAALSFAFDKDEILSKAKIDWVDNESIFGDMLKPSCENPGLSFVSIAEVKLGNETEIYVWIDAENDINKTEIADKIKEAFDTIQFNIDESSEDYRFLAYSGRQNSFFQNIVYEADLMSGSRKGYRMALKQEFGLDCALSIVYG